MKTAFACLVILAVVILSGCGQSVEKPSSTPTPTPTATAPDTSSAPTGTPAAAAVDATTPAATPTATAAATSTPASTDIPATTTATTTTPTANQTPDAITQEDIDVARQVVFAYWDCFNAYDIEGVLSYLDESWRQENAESLESDMGRLEAFGTTLGVEEEAEPTITPDGEIEIKIKVKTPLGSRHVTYRLIEVNGEWQICFSEG